MERSNLFISNNSEVGNYSILGEEPGSLDEPLVVGDNTNIRSHSVIYRGTKIGDNFQTGHGN